jgi:putative membrane protein
MDYLFWVVIAIAFVSMVYSIINFFRTYFIVQNKELILYTGIFQRKKLSIPFERIQTINFEQNIIHQFFSVLKLKIDTAGSGKEEFEFHAIEKDKAYALRDLVMAEKSLKPAYDPASDIQVTQDKHHQYTIMSLGQLQVLKVGLVENHMRSGLLIFIFLFGIYQNLRDVGVDVDDYSDEIPHQDLGINTILVLAFFFLFISVIISLARTLIKNFDLQFLRTGRGFKIVRGLFTKQEVSALDHKIQFLSWSDNLLKKWIGFKDLSLHQASSYELSTKQTIRIPGCTTQHIGQVSDALFGQSDFDTIQMSPIDERYFYRYAIIVTIIFGLITVVLANLFPLLKIIIVPLIGLYFIVTRYIRYIKISYGFNDELLCIKSGVFGSKMVVLPMYKIQALEIHQSPYQTRNKLASVSLYTAAGKLGIPYLPMYVCQKISDFFLYKVESDHRKWM